MIEIAYPWVLLALLLPLSLRFLLPKSTTKNYQTAALKIPHFKALQQNFAGLQMSHPSGSKIKYLWLVIWCLLVTSGAGIHLLGKPIAIAQSGRDLMMAIDLSGSMETADMVINDKPLSRIALVKKVANRFIERRTGDRLGLILFGSRPYLQTPLTFDLKTVQQMLEDGTVGIAGPQTAIGDAIGLAVKQLMDYPKDSKALILLTDGANNTGEIPPEKAAELAKDQHIKIYTIGLGASKMTVNTFFGPRVVNPSQDLDIKALQEIAKLTGGAFFRAEDAKDLENIYQKIDQLEPVKSDKVTVRPITPLYPWSLGLAMLLSFCTILLWLRLNKRCLKC